MTLKTFLAASVLAAHPLLAQDRDSSRTAPPDSQNVTILDITVDPNVNEPHTIFLAKHIVYKASFSEPGVTIRLRSFGNKQLPFVVPSSNGLDAGGGAEFELYPQADGEVQVLAVFNELQRPVHFRIWSDVRATRRGEASAAEGFWDIGFDFFVGLHPGAGVGSALDSHAGTTDGVCLSFRDGPGRLGRLNGCVGGFEWMSGETHGQYLELYTEPRFRVLGGAKERGKWSWEEGVLLRVGTYADLHHGANFENPDFGLGVYVARDLRSRDLGKGTRLSAALRVDRLTDGHIITTGPNDRGGAWTTNLAFGVGRYF